MSLRKLEATPLRRQALSARPPAARETTESTRMVSVVLLVSAVWIGAIYGFVYVDLISLPTFEKRVELVDAVLLGEGKADWVYAMYVVAGATRWLVSLVGHPRAVMAVVDFAGLVLVFGSAAFFLRAFFARPRSWFAGLFWLAATSPLLFRDHFYHPSDFYGVSLMFVVLVAAKRHRYLLLALLCLVSGMLWEKTLFVPVFFLAWEATSFGWKRGLARAAPALAAAGATFLFWRLAFPDAHRVEILTWAQMIDRLPADLTKWLLWTGPALLAWATSSARGRPIDRFWRLWLLYLPLLAGAVLFLTHFWGELRTFWILQPIFVGVIADWVEKSPPNGL